MMNCCQLKCEKLCLKKENHSLHTKGLLKESVIILQVILNTDISKRLKSSFFSHYVLKQTAQLLLTEAAESGSGDEESTCCQVAFHFLLRLCTDFQCGICYKSKPPPEGLER